MKKLLLTLFFVTIPIRKISATLLTDPNETFQQSNQMFEKGEFDKALSGYSNLISQGFEGTDLFYNMGNLYYRKGEIGKSVYWYEKALLLSPRDGDVRYNLSLAKSHIKEVEYSLSRKIISTFSVQETFVVLMGLSFAFFIILGLRILAILKPSNWSDIWLWTTGVTGVLTGLLFAINLSIYREPAAIVINPPGEVRNGPGMEYAVGFTIPEGSKVLILNKRPDWVQVGIPEQSLKGWIQTQDVKSLNDQILPSI